MNTKAKFICNPLDRPEPLPHPWDHSVRYFNNPDITIETKGGLSIFRGDFDLPEGTTKVTVSATALGIFNLFVNGHAVGNEELRPGWTDYHNRVQYQAYDVTKLLKNGCNVIADLLAEGWFCGSIPRHHNLEKPAYGPFPLLMQELHLTYDDGSTEKIVTDEQYHTVNTFPALKLSDIYAGETYDANEEPVGWLTSDSEVPLELPAKIFEGEIKKTFSQTAPNITQENFPKLSGTAAHLSGKS